MTRQIWYNDSLFTCKYKYHQLCWKAFCHTVSFVQLNWLEYDSELHCLHEKLMYYYD